MLALTIAAPCPAADDTGSCGTTGVERTVAEATGSTALLANLRGSADSLAAVAERLLGEALATVAVAACPAGCMDGSTTVVYRVQPLAYLDDTRQREECVTAERETGARPLDFAPQSFTDLDAMNDWIMAFTRGKGAAGKDLYRRCGSNCSPRYTFRIVAEPGGRLSLEPEVVCGLARDRNEPRYGLSTAIVRACAAP